MFIMFAKIFTLENKKNPIRHYLVVGMILSFINVLVFSLCFINQPELFKNSIEEEKIGVQLVMGGIIGPILETYLFQALIINFADNFLSLKPNIQKLIVIALSATIFAALHLYSWAYQLAMIIPGFIFAYGYWYFRKYKGQALAFTVVSALHMLYNLCVLCFGYFSENQ